MKIVVNTRLLISDKLSGIGWFAYHSLKRMIAAHPEHQFIFLFDRKYEEKFIFGSNVIPEVIFPPTRHPILSYIWFEHTIINKVKRHNPDIFYSPDGYLSLNLKDIPSLPVIHDLNYMHNPKYIPFVVYKYWSYYVPRYARIASRILTVSEFSKNDISQKLNVPLNKIDIAYNGANEIYSPISDEEKAKVKNEFAQGCDYLIYVGVLVPRKNVSGMIRGFNKFKKNTGSKTKLVIVGEKIFASNDIEKAYNEGTYKNEIIFTGRLSPEKLKFVMGAALALVLVSHFEGFGIPIVEAMYADVPVITSSVTSMPEIAGDAAILANPDSTDSISDAMVAVEKDSTLRKTLIEKAKIRRTNFTWDKTADAVWTSILKCLDE
jgi:glycosyltransferase involved in cell wall biosynthesis